MASATSEPEALVVSYWFEPGEGGEPYSATVRFTGRRVGTQGRPRPTDEFVRYETIEGIVPGSGPVSITARIYGLQPGEWTVGAELVRRSSGRGPARDRSMTARALRPASWSWGRWSLSESPATTVKTRWSLLAPLVPSPAVLPGVYTALNVLGALVALSLLAAILARAQITVDRSLPVSLLAVASGLVGAKVWYAVLHPDESLIRGGWAVDGFLVVAPLVATAALLAFRLPIGIYLDASAPGLFFAVAIGRIGCVFAGCCAGRCTASRWGLWSSDTRVGARRVPAQLLESVTGLLLGIATLLLVLGDPPVIHGAIAVTAFAAYALVRQPLLRLRAERRRSPRTLPATAAAAGIVVFVLASALLQQGT